MCADAKVTLDEAAIERAYNLAAIPCGTCVREHSGEHPPKSRPSRRPGRAPPGHGGAMAADRVRPTRALRATAGPRRPAPRRATDPKSRSPMVGRFPHRWSAGDARNPLRFKKLGVVARGGIEPPTRGFSVPGRFLKFQLHQPVGWASVALNCPTMQDRAGLIHAKLPQSDPTPDLLVRRTPGVRRYLPEPSGTERVSQPFQPSVRCSAPNSK